MKQKENTKNGENSDILNAKRKRKQFSSKKNVKNRNRRKKIKEIINL